jgi:hypothetical protein
MVGMKWLPHLFLLSLFAWAARAANPCLDGYAGIARKDWAGIKAADPPESWRTGATAAELTEIDRLLKRFKDGGGEFRLHSGTIEEAGAGFDDAGTPILALSQTAADNPVELRRLLKHELDHATRFQRAADRIQAVAAASGRVLSREEANKIVRERSRSSGWIDDLETHATARDGGSAAAAGLSSRAYPKIETMRSLHAETEMLGISEGLAQSQETLSVFSANLRSLELRRASGDVSESLAKQIANNRALVERSQARVAKYQEQSTRVARRMTLLMNDVVDESLRSFRGQGLPLTRTGGTAAWRAQAGEGAFEVNFGYLQSQGRVSQAFYEQLQARFLETWAQRLR